MKTLNKSYNVYISSCERDGGIYHYKLYENGSLKLISFTPMDRPMYMVTDGNKAYILLRAPFENSESGLVAYDIKEDGTLANPSDIISTKGEVACHLAVDGESVYCVNYVSGSVIKMPDTVITHTGKGINERRQESAHTHFVGLSPDKKYLLVTDLGLDKIFVYNKDLSVKSVVSMPLGHGPRHLACHENKRDVFCVNELLSTVSTLRYSDGKLTLTDTVKVLPEDFSGANTTAAIRCKGDKVYISNRGHDSVSVLDFSSGKLVLEKTLPTFGSEPRDFWIEEDFFAATNQIGNNVSFVSLDSGKLLSELKIKSPLCVLLK